MSEEELVAKMLTAVCPECGEPWLECPCDEECLVCGQVDCVCRDDNGPLPGEP